MNQYCFITTSYCCGCHEPTKEYIKNRFNIDAELTSIFVNFSNDFSPNDYTKMPFVGATKRRDLVYGKIFKLYDFIVNCVENKFEYICHFDFNDTFFCRSATEMMDKFISEGKDFLICAEKPCWPYIDTVMRWGVPTRHIPQADTNIANYLNSGVIIAKTSYLLQILNKLKELCLTKSIDFWDDQGVWQYYYFYMNQELNVDYDSEYTICTSFLKDDNFSLENNKVVVNNCKKSTPFIIHDNSSFSAILIEKYKSLYGNN